MGLEAESLQIIILTLRKHTYIMLTPLNPHFYIEKMGFTGTGYSLFFIFLLKT